ncbi:MAG: hypothetical protein ACTSYB_08940 [Candidatus Helarchaeota archaeon]
MAVTETMIGVVLAIIAGLMFTYGAVLQKKAVEAMPDIKMSDLETIKPLLKNRTWVTGVIIGVLGGLPYVFSQLYIGIGYTQLLIATGLILLAYMASKMLHESLGIMEYSGITLIVAGTIFLGLAQLSPVNVTLSEPNFFLNMFLFYSPLFTVSAIGLLFYKFSDKGAAKILAAISGIIFGCGAGFSQVGIMGLADGNWLVFIVGYLILLIGTVIATVIANVAFQKGKAVVVIPIQSAGNYLIPVVAGLLLFQQIFAFGIWFYPSVVLIMAGVFLLSRIQAEMEEALEEAGEQATPPSSSTEPLSNP